jgi:hypothetical protein
VTTGRRRESTARANTRLRRPAIPRADGHSAHGLVHRKRIGSSREQASTTRYTNQPGPPSPNVTISAFGHSIRLRRDLLIDDPLALAAHRKEVERRCDSSRTALNRLWAGAEVPCSRRHGRSRTVRPARITNPHRRQLDHAGIGERLQRAPAKPSTGRCLELALLVGARDVRASPRIEAVVRQARRK